MGDRSGTIFKISPDREIFVFATLEPSVAAYHLAFSPAGELFVTGPTTSSFDRVYRISPAGEVSVFFRGMGRPQGLAFDRAGNLYVAASLGGRRGIVRLTPQADPELVLGGSNIVGLALLPTPPRHDRHQQRPLHARLGRRGPSPERLIAKQTPHRKTTSVIFARPRFFCCSEPRRMIS